MSQFNLFFPVEEEQARERYLKRIGDRTNVHGSTFSTMSVEMPSGILLSPSGLEPISVPVPPPPSPEVPHSGVTLGSLQDLMPEVIFNSFYSLNISIDYY